VEKSAQVVTVVEKYIVITGKILSLEYVLGCLNENKDAPPKSTKETEIKTVFSP
jgi:hypothetical protein